MFSQIVAAIFKSNIPSLTDLSRIQRVVTTEIFFNIKTQFSDSSVQVSAEPQQIKTIPFVDLILMNMDFEAAASEAIRDVSGFPPSINWCRKVLAT